MRPRRRRIQGGRTVNGKKQRRRPPWRTWALALCAGVFVLSTGMLVRDLLRASREQEAYLRLAQRVREAEEAGTPETGAGSGRLAGYALLHQENPDLAGWLAIPGTVVDYPVMFTPEEPEYYLRRAFDGSYAVGGSLFIGEGCTPEGSHVIIYGHRMDNGSMFGGLSAYAQADYAAEHPVIRYDTLDREGEYQVMAAFYSRVYTDRDENVFRYYQYSNLSDPAVFQSYVDQVKAAALYDTGVEASYGDRLLTLSTCSYHTDDGRFVVVARQAAGPLEHRDP